MKKSLYAIAALILIGLSIWLFLAAPKIPAPQDSAVATPPAGFALATTTIRISHDDSLATVDIEYPKLSLSGVSDAVVLRINDDIAAQAILYEKEFFTQVQGFQSNAADLPPEAPRDSEYYRRYQAFASPRFGIVSVLYSDEQAFPGYAHPSSYFDAENYDAQTGNIVSLESMIQPGKLPELYQRFIAALRQKYSLPADTYNLTADRLPPFSHFIVEDAGLHLYADQDSILAHVEGPADASLPWADLSDIVSLRFKR